MSHYKYTLIKHTNEQLVYCCWGLTKKDVESKMWLYVQDVEGLTPGLVKYINIVPWNELLDGRLQDQDEILS